MYTILRLEYDNLITYMMILTDSLCSNYDFLTYDYTKSLFVDESFTIDSFTSTCDDCNNVCVMMEKISLLIEKKGLKSLMYDDIHEFEGMSIEVLHVPEGLEFVSDELYRDFI